MSTFYLTLFHLSNNLTMTELFCWFIVDGLRGDNDMSDITFENGSKLITFTTPGNNSNFFKDIFTEQVHKPIWIGVDWVEDSGMNRGDIISQNGNVTEVRFKTVTFL